MHIERIPINQLQPASYNPRITLRPGDAGWAKLERSLAEFDLVQPLVWNRRTGHVVGGHQRLEVLRHQGATEVDCAIVDLPLEREQALNVALNNSEVGGDWDPGKLVDLLAELQTLPDFDATLTGYDAQQLRDLVLTPETCPESDDIPDESDDSGLGRVELEFPADDWAELEQDLNSLLAIYPQLRLHLLG